MKNLMKAAAYAVALVSLPAVLFSQEIQPQLAHRFTINEVNYAKKDPKYYQLDLKSVKVEKVKEEELNDFSYFGQTTLDEFGQKEDDTFVIIDKIINIAKKIWGIVKDNKPVVNVTTKYANAVPKGIKSWTQLQNWKRPRVYTYGFYAKNVYGMTVINVRYKVIYTYGGDYKGKGKYLTGVTIVPENVDVAWGYRFDMLAEVPDSTVTNAGTYENPLAALQLKLAWTIATVIKESRGTSIYYIQGDGYMNEIASPFKFRKDIKDVETLKPVLLRPISEVFN